MSEYLFFIGIFAYCAFAAWCITDDICDTSGKSTSGQIVDAIKRWAGK